MSQKKPKIKLMHWETEPALSMSWQLRVTSHCFWTAFASYFWEASQSNNIQPNKTLWPVKHQTVWKYWKFEFHILMCFVGRFLGCSEKGTSPRNFNLFVWSTVFQPKWNDIQKSYRNYQDSLKSFLGYFLSLFNFCWKTAAQIFFEV